MILRLDPEDIDALADAIVARMQPARADNDTLTLRECGVPIRTLRAAIASGELVASKVGREYRVRRAALDAWIAARRVAPRERPEREQSPAERAIARARTSGALRLVGGRAG